MQPLWVLGPHLTDAHDNSKIPKGYGEDEMQWYLRMHQVWAGAQEIYFDFHKRKIAESKEDEKKA